MFENLSSREKKLLIVIGALVPIAIVFLCVYQMTSSFKANNEQLNALKLEILNEEKREIEGMHAARRQTYYSNTSLHPSDHIAGHDYQAWLKEAMRDSGLTNNTTNPAASSEIRSGNQTIGKRQVFKVAASGTLPQFNGFLCKFYQLDALHRINFMRLTPENERGNANKVRTGEISIKMDVEALSLKSGKEREGFEEFRTNLVNKEKDYQPILNRNIFGPANSPPIITASNKTWTTGTGKAHEATINFKDANKDDRLEFELIETSVENAKLEEVKTNNRRAVFKMPDVEPGKYDFKIKVTDDGFPNKSSTKKFTVTIKERRKTSTVKTSQPKEEEIDYILLTKVTGIKHGVDGKLRVWVSVGPTGDRWRLAEGETFELSKKEYKVVSIDSNEIKFVCGEKTFTARLDNKTHGAVTETTL